MGHAQGRRRARGVAPRSPVGSTEEPGSVAERLMHLQRSAGNRAVAQVLRDNDDAPAAAPGLGWMAGAARRALAERDAEALRAAASQLTLGGAQELGELLSDEAVERSVVEQTAALLTDAQRRSLFPWIYGRAGEPPLVQYARILAQRYPPQRAPAATGSPIAGTPWTLGPLTREEAETAARLAGRSLEDLIAGPGPGQPPVREWHLVYFNDGRDPFPNIGAGGDQGLTGGAALRWVYEGDAADQLARAGLNVEVWTPTKGGAPEGGQYPGGEGAYAGLIYIDFAYRVARSGDAEVNLLTELGASSPVFGREGQGAIHRAFEIAEFQWPDDPGGPYGALGAEVRTVKDLIDHREFRSAQLRLRLALDARALVGTHRSGAEAGGELELRAGDLSLEISAAEFELARMRISLEGAVGARGKAAARYLQGDTGDGEFVEATVTTRLGLRLEEVRALGRPLVGPDSPLKAVRLALEAAETQSTDPAMRTPEAGRSLVGVPGMAQGGHGEGRVSLMVELGRW